MNEEKVEELDVIDDIKEDETINDVEVINDDTSLGDTDNNEEKIKEEKDSEEKIEEINDSSENDSNVDIAPKKKKLPIIILLSIFLVLDISVLVIYLIGIDKVFSFIK